MQNPGAILLAEDNDDDIFIIRRAFGQAGLIESLHVVPDGAEAIAYLKGEGKYSDRVQHPPPTLLLLDLKMPRKTGFDVLQWIRADPAWRPLRVIVLTTSSDLRDVNRAYQLGANSFLVKPADFEKTMTLIRALKDYWLVTGQLTVDPSPLETFILPASIPPPPPGPAPQQPDALA